MLVWHVEKSRGKGAEVFHRKDKTVVINRIKVGVYRCEHSEYASPV